MNEWDRPVSSSTSTPSLVFIAYFQFSFLALGKFKVVPRIPTVVNRFFHTVFYSSALFSTLLTNRTRYDAYSSQDDVKLLAIFAFVFSSDSQKLNLTIRFRDRAAFLYLVRFRLFEKVTSFDVPREGRLLRQNYSIRERFTVRVRSDSFLGLGLEFNHDGGGGLEFPSWEKNIKYGWANLFSWRH